MKDKRIPVLLAALALLAAPVSHAQSMTLQKVLDHINASAAKFHDVQADISVDLYTAVVQDHQMQYGMTAFRRKNGALEMVTDLKAANGQTVAELLFKNSELDYYQPPPASQETIFPAAANRGEFDSFLATGFGATSQEFSSQWNITFQGMQAIDGQQTAKLDLVPKQANIRNNYFSHLTIWVDLSRDISLKQVMVQPDGDSRTVTYSHIRYNTHLPDSLFKLHVAKGTQVTRK